MAISVNNEGTLKELAITMSPTISGIDYISELIDPPGTGRWVTFPRAITSYLICFCTLCDKKNLGATTPLSNKQAIFNQDIIQRIYKRSYSYPDTYVTIANALQIKMEYGNTSKAWFGYNATNQEFSSVTILGAY